MKLQIIASSPGLLQSLQGMALQHGAEVLSAVQRVDGQPLAPVLDGRDAQALLLEAPAAHRQQDLDAVSAWRAQVPGLQVLLLSEDDSAQVLRQAMRAGVHEVLALPLQAPELAQALQRLQSLTPDRALAATDPGPPGHPSSLTSPPDPAAQPGQVLAVIGAKGGSGASLVATQLAWLASESFGQRCALVDLDLQCGDASFYAGNGAYPHSVVDAAQALERLDVALLESLLHPLAPGLHLLAAPADPEQAVRVQAAQLARIVPLLQAQHRCVVIDVPRQLDALAIKALDLASRICLVTEPVMSHLRDAKRLLKVFRSLGYADDRVHLVVNRHRPGPGVDDASIEQLLALRIAQHLPPQPAQVEEAIGSGQPLLHLYPHGALTQALMVLASQLLHQPVPSSRSWFSRLLGHAA